MHICRHIYIYNVVVYAYVAIAIVRHQGPGSDLDARAASAPGMMCECARPNSLVVARPTHTVRRGIVAGEFV